MLLTDIQNDLLNRILDEYAQNIIDESLQHQQSIESVNFLLKNLAFLLFDHRRILESAVDILDESEQFIHHYGTTSLPQRHFWTVKGSQGNEYICLQNFCPCPYFLQHARMRPGRTFCKHLLAIRIYSAMYKDNIIILSDEQFALVMCGEERPPTTNNILFHN